MIADNFRSDIMNVRNRMADIVKLRCNVCQEFLKLIICDGWQLVV